MATNDPVYKAQPNLAEVLQQLQRNIFLQMNCHAVGIIRAFNSTTQLAQVEIAYSKVQYVLSGSLEYTKTTPAYPLIASVPVIILSGGDARLEMPIQPGDECLLLFNDRDFTTWWDNGQPNQAPSTPRAHSFSDAIALVGVTSKVNAYSNFDSTRASLRNGTTRVGVSSSKVLIENNTKTLKALLDSTNGILKVVNQLATLITPTTGLTAGNLATIQAQIVALNTQIGGLLE
jgi:hypothetical protein